jgi:uncharacterized protein YjdB
VLFDEPSNGAAVTSISLNMPAAALSLTGMAELQLTAAVLPADAADKTVIWESSNSAVASVDDTGLVTAHEPGAALITATTRDGGKTAACVVTVSANSGAAVTVTGISLNVVEAALSLLTGTAELQLTATVLPADAADMTVIWESSNNAVASVDDTGLVTANGPGDAQITATTRDGGKTADCAVTVSADGRNNVSGFTAVPGDTMIYLYWENPGASDFAGVELSWQTGANPSATTQGLDASIDSYQITGLANDVLYTVKIRARYAGSMDTGGVGYVYSGWTAVIVRPDLPNGAASPSAGSPAAGG